MRAAPLSLALLACGCALLPPSRPDPFPLSSPGSFGGAIRAEQRLTVTRAGGASTLQAFVEIDRERVTLVGASALGQRVISLTWDAAGLREDGASDGAAAEQALRDLQLVAWPLAALQAAAAGSEFRIEEPRPGTRVVWRGEQPWAEVHYAGRAPLEGRAWLVNFEQRYTLDLDSRPLP